MNIGAGTEPAQVPKNYVCIDRSQRSLVFDFFKGFNQDERETVRVHLGLCLHCREAVATMLKLNKYLHPREDNYLHAERPDEVASEAEGASPAEMADREAGLCAPACGGDVEEDFSLQAHLYGN